MGDKILALTIKVKGTAQQTVDLGKLQGSIDAVKRELKKLNAEEKAGRTSAEEIARKRSELTLQLKANQNAYRDLEATVLKSNDALRKNSGFVEGIKKAIGETVPSFTQLAGAFGLGLGISETIGFLKDSVNAFIEAEKNARQLEFALTNIGKEGSKAFNELMDQSDILQQNSIFSDDSIQQAQTALVQYGLTSEEIKKLTPLIVDLASAQNIDLATATDKAISAINGQTKGLKEAGIQFKDTGSKTENYNKLIDGLAKFQGSATDAIQTTDGKLKQFANSLDNTKEIIGNFFVTAFEGFSDLNAIFNPVAAAQQKVEDFISQKNELRRTRTKALNEELIALDDAALKKRLALEQNLIAQIADGKFKSTREEVRINIETQKIIKSILDQRAADLGEANNKEINSEKQKQNDLLASVQFRLNEEDTLSLERDLKLDELDKLNQEKMFDKQQFLLDEKAKDLNAELSLYQSFKAKETEVNQQELTKQLQQQELFASSVETLVNGLTAAYILSMDDRADGTKRANKAIVISILDTVEKIVTAQVASAAAQSYAQPDSVATFGATGTVRAILIGALIKGAFAVAKASISNSFAQGGIIPDGGGIIQGPSHAKGGVKFMAGGMLNEAQGGEPILVKEAGSDPFTRSILSAINVAHGGKAFANGGVVPSYKHALGGLTAPAPKASLASIIGAQRNSEDLLQVVNTLIDNKIARIKVVNVASDTANTATKVSNIQNEGKF